MLKYTQRAVLEAGMISCSTLWPFATHVVNHGRQHICAVHRRWALRFPLLGRLVPPLNRVEPK